MTPSDIAKDYGVLPSAISQIRNHRTWKEYTEGIEFEKLKPKGIPKYNLITQYDMKGNVIGVYKTIAEAEEKTHVSYACISNVCRGKYIAAGGYVWRYNDDAFEKFRLIKKENSNAVPVDQYKDGLLIRTYNSIQEAKRATGAPAIGSVLDKDGRTSGGFEWKRHKIK